MCGVAAPEKTSMNPAGVASASDRSADQQVFLGRNIKRTAMVLSPVILVMFAWAMWSNRVARPNVPRTAPIHAVPSPSTEPDRSDASASPVPPQGVENASELRRIAPTPTSSDINPAELWKQVKRGSTSAEVALALLYIRGQQIQQNCGQARLLLEAAANKGSARAIQLLTSAEDWAHCSN